MNQSQQPNNLFPMYPRPCAQGEFIFVKGEQMARDFPAVNGSLTRYIDLENDYMYIKRMGYVAGEPYDFQRIKLTLEPPPAPPQSYVVPEIDTSQFATRAQFDSLNSKLDSLIAAIGTANERRDNFNRKNRDRDKEVVQDAK